MAKNAKTGTKVRLSISKIEADRDVQPRAATDKAVVAEYAASIKANAKLPPVEVYTDGKKNWLAEGFHRLAAHRQAGRKQIDCIMHPGDKDDAKWHALKSNQTHGLRRTNEDKARAVKMALEHPKGAKMSDRQIAELVGVSPTTVGQHRKKVEPTVQNGQSKTRTGRDGRTTNVARIGKTKKTTAKPSAKPEAKAGDKTPPPKADHGAGQHAEVAADIAKDGLVEGVLHGKPLEVYGRVLGNLPDALAKLAEHADKIVGKAMEPKAARKALARIWKSLKVFHDAETKLAAAKEST